MAGWAGCAANEPARACPAPATRPSSSRMRNEDRAVGDPVLVSPTGPSGTRRHAAAACDAAAA